MAGWRPAAPHYTRGYGHLFLEHVLQANEGCDFDFLRGADGEHLRPVERFRNPGV